jgi:hypothetical protein
MLKKLMKLAYLVQAARRGHGYGHGGYKPWKGKKKWKRHGYGYGPPPGYGPGYEHGPGPGYGHSYGHGPGYGYGRPRGLKGIILEAVVRRLFGHR